MEWPSTFSIVAHDPVSSTWGVAVQSKFLACGSIVPWAEALAGAIATQARANYNFGPNGMKLLREGLHATEVLERLLQSDADHHLRQIAVLDRDGNTAAYTGSSCLYWAGHKSGKNVSCQGNILADPAVVEAMYEAFGNAEGDLAEKMITALEAGQAAGGDRRGKQSAGIVVVKRGAGFSGMCDRYIDLRIDDHPLPIPELRRLVALHRVTFPQVHEGVKYRLEEPVTRAMAEWLCLLGEDLGHEPPSPHAVIELAAKQTGVEAAQVPEGWVDGQLVAGLRALTMPLYMRQLEEQEKALRTAGNP